MSCNDGRFTCGGAKMASSCVSYQGASLLTIDPTTLPCAANINDIISSFDLSISNLKSVVDVTGLSKKGLVIDLTKSTQKDLNQLLINTVSGLNAQMTTLQTTVNNLNIFNQTIQVDISGLFGGVQCNATNQYTIGFLISTLVNEIINIKKKINS